jgi:hypothetical protein
MAGGDRSYDEQGEVPLGGYAVLATAYAVSAGLVATAARRRGVRLPDRVPPWDVVLMGAATFKVSRLVAKDKVTSFLRAPFTRRTDESTASEVMDEPRGSGIQRAVGELASCPFCTSVWVAGAVAGGYVFAPRATRLLCAGMGAVTVADWLHFAWSRTGQKVEG